MTRVSVLVEVWLAVVFISPNASAQTESENKLRCEVIASPASQDCLLTRALEAEKCSAVLDNQDRLACYDKLLPVATLSGSSSGKARCADAKDEDERRRCQLTLAGRLPDCAVHTDPTARLACTDSVARRRVASEATGKKIPIDPTLGWKLRDEVAVSAIGLRAVSKSGAKLAYTGDKGKESLKGSAAALYVWDNTSIDWQPFAGIGWKGDNGALPKSGSVTLSAGAQTSWQWLGITSQPSLLLSQRHERYVERDSTQITLNNDLLFDSLQGLTAGGVAYDLVPLFGLNSAKVSSTVGAAGVTTGGYAGMRFTFGHKKMFPRTTLEGFGQWYGDARELPGTERRRVRYGTLKIVHNMADPAAKSGWVPAITLTGTRGTEPVRGEVGLRKVSLELSVRFD